MTAAEVADKLIAAGGDTASLSPAEQELLMRALRSWDEMLAALIKLSNEVLGGLPLIEPLARREMGNTNYSIIIQRAEEARAAIASAAEGSMACPGGGWTGMPNDMQKPTVRDCVDSGNCGCDLGDAYRKVMRP